MQRSLAHHTVTLTDPSKTTPVAHELRSSAAPTGPHRTRVVAHPGAYALRGIPVRCTACGARRDWALINQGRHVWVRCRCGHEWHEPEITRADFDALVRSGGAITYPSAEHALDSLGFDGSFRGLYLG